MDIANALMLPRERPPSLSEFKRTLLTYDSVTVLALDDRELIPRHSMPWAMSGGMMPIGMDFGPILPLGKTPGFDADFASTLDQLRPALEQGSVSLIEPTVHMTGRLSIGAIQLPERSPDPRGVLGFFRVLAANSDFLRLVVPRPSELSGLSDSELEALAPDGSGHREINTLPPPIEYDGDLPDERLRPALTRLARSRLGSAVRGIAYAHVRGLQPVTEDAGMAAVLQRMAANVERLEADAQGETESWETLDRLTRLHQLVLAEFVDQSALDAMSVAEVLKLRSRAWGRAQEARVMLFATLRELTLEEESQATFERAAKGAIENYVKVYDEVRHDWANLRIRVACEIGGAVAAGGSGVLQNYLGLSSLELLLLLGGVFFAAGREHLPQVRDILRKEREAKSSAGYSLISPYAPLIRL